MSGFSPYTCPSCGVTEDRLGTWIDVPEPLRAYKGQQVRVPERCTRCGTTMDWTPVTAYNDLVAGGIHCEIGSETRVFSSLHEMREYSSESHRRARSGDGVAINFRALEQTASNMDRNSLKGSEFERNSQIPVSDFMRRTGRRKILKAEGGPMAPPVD